MVRLIDVDRETLSRPLSRFGLLLVETRPDQEIPGSYWGDSEAGFVGSELHARPDTPLH